MPAYELSGVAGLDVGEDALELLRLFAELRIARFRLRTNPLEPLLDVVAVGDDELELELLLVAVGIGIGIEVREHGDQRIGLPELAENGGAQSRRVDDPDRRGRRLRGALDRRDRGKPLIRDRRDADMRLSVRLAGNAASAQ